MWPERPFGFRCLAQGHTGTHAAGFRADNPAVPGEASLLDGHRPHSFNVNYRPFAQINHLDRIYFGLRARCAFVFGVFCNIKACL